MSPAVAVQQITQAMILVMLLSMPPIIVASVVGIIVSLLQALTQVQEQTLSFAIKLIAVAATIAAMAGFLGSEMVTYTLKLFDEFPKYTHVSAPRP
jgi:type III secretion protein S